MHLRFINLLSFYNGKAEEARLLLGTRNGPSHAFGVAAATLGHQPAPLRCESRPCPPAEFGLFGCLADQLDQPADRVLTVSFLRTEPPGVDNQQAVFGNPPAGQMNQTLPNVIRQRGGVAHVEAELHGRGNLVDVLPARPRGSDEFLLDFALVDCYGACDVNHGSGLRPASGPLECQETFAQPL